MVANVLVELTNRNIDKTFTYNVPAFMEGDIKVGIRVEVPFGKQKLEGFVLSIEEESSFQTDLKDIISLIDSNVILNDELLSLGCFIKESTLCTLISAYQAMLPKAFKAKKNVSINKKFDKFISLNVPVDNCSNYKFNDRQKALIEKLIIAKVKKKS
jgi:primosomal protein N' (replication factor Y)